MKKILVTTFDELVPSETAYQICEVAQSMYADLVFLYLVDSSDSKAMRRGRFAIEVFEDASQYYDVQVEGLIMSGEPMDQIVGLAKQKNVDLIMLGASEQFDWHPTLKSIEKSCGPVPAKLFDPDSSFSDPDCSLTS